MKNVKKKPTFLYKILVFCSLSISLGIFSGIVVYYSFLDESFTEIAKVEHEQPLIEQPAPSIKKNEDIKNINTASYPEYSQETIINAQPINEDIQNLDKKDLKPLWKKNAVSFTPKDNQALVAIIIDDLGLNYEITKEIIALDGPLTLSFLPYATRLKEQVYWAQEKGHELLVHVPMEPLSKTEDPGPNTLKITLNDIEFMRRLRWNLDQFSGYVGINNHMGSRVTANKYAMVAVMQELKLRGLVFVDSLTTARSITKQAAEEMQVPHLSRDVFIDNEDKPESIQDSLRKIEDIAQKSGYAIAIGHPRPLTLQALQEWLPTLAEKNIQIAPISALFPAKRVNKTTKQK